MEKSVTRIALLCIVTCCGLSACQKKAEVGPNDAVYFEEMAKQQAKLADDAAALLLRSTTPSPAVDQALVAISEYEDKTMRLEKTIKVADGSLHIGLQKRYPKLGIVVHHYDQKFTHASRIPSEKGKAIKAIDSDKK
jgi:hypothetical protein